MLLSMLAPPGAVGPEELIKLYMEANSMTYAMVQDNIVINVIEWDGVTPYTPPQGCELHAWDGPISIGWEWVNGAPVDPTPPPPPPEPVVNPAQPAEGGPTVL